MSARPRKPQESRAWGYSAGHAWRYDVETIPSSMEVRFHARDESVAAGFCGCECGVCKPGHPHSVEDGCVCSLFGCFCSTTAPDRREVGG